jgi:5-deoxy-glucuronate isomerase
MNYRFHCTAFRPKPCDLRDLEFLRLDTGQSWTGRSGEREILAVIVVGAATFTIGSEEFVTAGGRANVYIPAGSAITIEATEPVEIALPGIADGSR